MKSSYSLLQHLSHEQFISGNALGSALGVSRAAVWKMVKHCMDVTGVDIFSVKGKGYCLAQPLELLSEAVIRQHLSASCHDCVAKIEVVSRCDSTNTQLHRRGAGLDSGTILFAEQQTAGRGRNGRSWISPFAQNLYFSMYWRSNLPIMALSGFSLALGVVVLRGLKELGFVQEIGLKWPNDILYQGAKLAGFLVEILGEANGTASLIIGVGINVKMDKLQGELIDQRWTDLSTINDAICLSRNSLAATMVNQICILQEVFSAQGFQSYREEWIAHDCFHRLPVDLFTSDGIIQGIEDGVDESGALQLIINGEQHKIYSGDVSLRIKGSLQ